MDQTHVGDPVRREKLPAAPPACITLVKTCIQLVLSLTLFARRHRWSHSQLRVRQPTGMRPRIEKLGQNVGRLKPSFDQIHPGSWTIEGGAEAYQKQQKACADGLTYVQNAVARWSAQPDKLSLMLETLIRIESMDQQAISLSQGIRKYQNPAVADILDSMLNSLSGELGVAAVAVARDGAAAREGTGIAQKEAQRCGTQILQPQLPEKVVRCPPIGFACSICGEPSRDICAWCTLRRMLESSVREVPPLHGLLRMSADARARHSVRAADTGFSKCSSNPGYSRSS